MRSSNNSGFSMLAVLFLASIIGLAAMSLPSIMQMRDTLKQKYDRASYKQTVQQLLRRKIGRAAAWDVTSCDNATQSCPPTGIYPKNENFTVPNCDPDPNNLGKCQFNIQITRDDVARQLIYSLQEGDRTDFIEWFRVPYLAILACDGEDGRFIFNNDQRSAGIDKGTNCQSIGDHAGVPSDYSDEIMGRCPAGKYMVGIDVGTKSLDCRDLPATPTNSCTPGQYIKSYNWVYGDAGTLDLELECADRKGTI